MGSVPGPVFAEILLNHHERTWLANCPSHFKPAYYRRYVDDCFLLFRSPSHGTQFLNYLNSQHPNVKFFMFEKRESLDMLR